MNSEDIVQIDTLLKGLNDDDFDCVISQEKLRARGHLLHFVVDAGLVYNYCFPEGIEPLKTHPQRRAKLNPEYIADEQVTLHSIFFLDQGRDRVVLFDEYVSELEGMISEAVNHRATWASTGTILDVENFHSSSELWNLAFDSFSVILADVLRHLNGLRKVKNIFDSNALIINSEDLKNDFVSKTTQLIKGTKKNTDRIKKVLTKIIKDELFESKKRDAVVFDRVLSINNFIQKFGERPDRKHVFILLTDSTIMRRLGKVLMVGYKDIEYPDINGDLVELTRSVQQTFIYLISIARNADNSIDYSKTIRNLQLLKEYNKDIRQQITQTEQLIQGKNPQKANFDLMHSTEYRHVFDNYKKLRNAFENTGFLKSFQSLYDSIKAFLMADKKLSGIKVFFEAIEKLIDELNKELDDKQLKLLKRLKDEAIFNTAFINGIEQIKDMGDKFVLSKGGDIIEGSYQHLPIFLTFSKNIEFQHQMFNLMILILTKNTDNSQSVIEELGGLLSNMMLVKSNVDFPIEVKLLKAFLFVILPAGDDTSNDEIPAETINNKRAFSWLELLDQNNQISDPELHADLIYLLCWTARRIPDYKRSIDYAQKGIAQYPNDPRFYHGRFLAEYCQYTSDTVKDKDLLGKMEENLDRASVLYNSFLRRHYSRFNLGLLSSKLFDTFSNNFCSLYTLKAESLRQAENYEVYETEIRKILNIARMYLNHLKVDKRFREALPEYYDTEANLELLEAEYIDKEKKLDKLMFAKKAIETAVMLSSHPGLIEKYNLSLSKISNAILKIKLNELE